MDEVMQCLRQAGIRYRQGCSLRDCNTLRLGGEAELALFPDTRERLISALAFLEEAGCPYVVVGKGSNLLFPDGVCKRAIVFTGGCAEWRIDGDAVTASAGTPLVTVAMRARERSLGGAEFAAGIPGTVGGAVLMNAGAFGGSMRDIVVRSEYWDRVTRTVGVMERDAHRFGTRTSVYAEQSRYVLLGAELKLFPRQREEIDARMEDYRRRRAATQPLSLPNAGSIFKHPVGHYAGKLIEECGLKGARVGDAEVSQLHTGFIVNRGQATERDVRELIKLIRQTVLDRTGVYLECELRALDGEPL